MDVHHWGPIRAEEVGSCPEEGLSTAAKTRKGMRTLEYKSFHYGDIFQVINNKNYFPGDVMFRVLRQP